MISNRDITIIVYPNKIRNDHGLELRLNPFSQSLSNCFSSKKEDRNESSVRIPERLSEVFGL